MSDVRTPRRELSMCFGGALERKDSTFARVCEVSAPGLLSNGSEPVHESFLRSTAWQLYPRLFDALDTNGDGKVNGEDAPTNVNLVGYSWGGVAANEVAQQLKNDSRVATERKGVAKLVAIDAFQPFGEMRVPSNVAKFRSFRQTNSADLTKDMFLGPYRGIRPVCAPTTDCRDFDLTIRPTPTDGHRSPGSAVQHVTMPDETSLPVYMLLQQNVDMEMRALGAEVPILRDEEDE